MQDNTLYEEIEKMAKKENIEIFKISAVSGEGIKELINYVSKVLKELPKEDLIEIEERVVYTMDKNEKDFEVELRGGEYIVRGPAVDRIMRRVNVQDRESMHFLQKKLEEVGIFGELRRMGIQEGDTVKMLEWEFEWYN